MDLTILGVQDKNTKDERVEFKVLKDTNLKHYMVLDNTYDEDDEISNKDRHIFSFPDYPIKKDHYVMLYTRPLASKKKNDVSENGLTHWFTWNFQDSHRVWNDERDTVTLIKVANFSKKPV
jgi:hypothetical protein